MKKSLRQFMTGIIDYAGLFPPSQLPLDQAIHNYADYRKGNDSWMLSRFILPVDQFEAVGAYSDELFTADQPFSFSVLGRKTESTDAFRNDIRSVVESCNSFCETHRGQVKAEMLEVKLPPEAAFSQDVDELKQLMDDTAEQLASSVDAPVQIFYESKFGEQWRGDNTAVIQALAAHNEAYAGSENYQFAAYKIRCGGVNPDLFPSVAQVAFALNETRDAGVALKGTAGLHHPVRHYADEVQTKMHGFFNVFGGAMLTHANDFDEEMLQQVLKEEDPEAFTFTDQAFVWNDYSVTTEEIEELRNSRLLSYGSCSFDEPREDLAQLKLL